MVYITEEICDGNDAYGRPMTNHEWLPSGEYDFPRAPHTGGYTLRGEWCGTVTSRPGCVIIQKGEPIGYAKEPVKTCQVPDEKKEIDEDGQEGPDYMMECMMAGGIIDMSPKIRSSGGIQRGPVFPWEFFPVGSEDYLRLLQERRDAVRRCDPDVIETIVSEQARSGLEDYEPFTMEECLERKARLDAEDQAKEQWAAHLKRLEDGASANYHQKWVFTDSVNVMTNMNFPTFEYNQNTTTEPTFETCIKHCQGDSSCIGVSIKKDETGCTGHKGVITGYYPDRHVKNPTTGLMMKRDPRVSPMEGIGDWENRVYFSKDDTRGTTRPYLHGLDSYWVNYAGSLSEPLQYELDLQVKEYDALISPRREKFSLTANGKCGVAEESKGTGTGIGTRCPGTQCCGLPDYGTNLRYCGGEQGQNDSFCKGRSIATKDLDEYDGLGDAADQDDRQERIDKVYYCLANQRCRYAWNEESDPECKDLKYPPKSDIFPTEWDGKSGQVVCPKPTENNVQYRTLDKYTDVRRASDGHTISSHGWHLRKDKGGWGETDYDLGEISCDGVMCQYRAAADACREKLKWQNWKTVGFATWRTNDNLKNWWCREYRENDNKHPYDDVCVNKPWTDSRCLTKDVEPSIYKKDIEFKTSEYDYRFNQGGLYWRRTTGDEVEETLDEWGRRIIVDDDDKETGWIDNRTQDGKPRSTNNRCGREGNPPGSRCGGDTACCSSYYWCGGTRGIPGGGGHCGADGVGTYENGDYDALPLSAPDPPAAEPAEPPAFHYSDVYPTGDSYEERMRGGCWTHANQSYYKHGDPLCTWRTGLVASKTSCDKSKCPSDYIADTTDGFGRARTIHEYYDFLGY
jgi:hypothetical protein